MNWPVYERLRDWDAPWLGGVPADWAVTAVKNRFDIVLGKMLNAGVVAKEGSELPYLRAGNIQPHGLDISEVKSTHFTIAEKKALNLKRGDLIVVEGGAGFGRSAVLSEDLEGWGFQNHVMRLRPKHVDRADFLNYVMLSLNSNGHIATLSNHATIPSLSSDQLGRILVPFPDVEAQTAIVSFLDRETAKIDALIDKQEQLIATLREDRAATITQAVTKGLDPNARLRETGANWVDRIPENWTFSRFSRHISINSGQVDPRLEPYRDMTLIAPNHVEPETGKLLEAESAEEQGADSGKYRVSAGQVIYSKIRPNLAKATIAPVDCLCSADMYGLSTDPNELSSRFLLYELLSQPFTNYVIDSSMRVAMPKVNHDSLGAAPIWFPSIEEQYKVVEFLDARCARIDALIDKSTKMIEMLREYRSALITNAVTGKIDVREAV